MKLNDKLFFKDESNIEKPKNLNHLTLQTSKLLRDFFGLKLDQQIITSNPLFNPRWLRNHIHKFHILNEKEKSKQK